MRTTLARLIHSINVTLDGCCDHLQSIPDDEHHEYALALLRGASGLVLGRNTFELFENHWPQVARSGKGPEAVVALARAIDSIPRFVASRHRRDSQWAGTEFLSGDVPGAIRALKQRVSGDLVLFGSPGFARALAEANEIDEYHFLVQPIVAGRGPKVFDGLAGQLDLVHLDTKVFRPGVHLTRWLPGALTNPG